MKFKFGSARTASTVIASAVLTASAAGIVGLGSAHASSVEKPGAELVSPPHTSAVYAFYGNGKGQRIWCSDEIEAGKFPVRELSSWAEVNALDMQVGEGRLVKTCDQLENLLDVDQVELTPEFLRPPHTSALYIKYGNGKGQKIWCGDEVELGQYPVRELSSWAEINELDMQVSEGRLVKTCDQLADLMKLAGPPTTVEPTTTSGPTTTVEETTTTERPTTTVEETTTTERPTTTSGPTTTVGVTDPVSERVANISVRDYITLDLNNGLVRRSIAIVEMDDGTVTRDLNNLYQLGIEQSRIQNPNDWGVLSRIGNTEDFRVRWGNAETVNYLDTTVGQPGSVDEKLDGCFNTNRAFRGVDDNAAESLDGTVCFKPGGTFTASRGRVAGSYSINKFVIELDFENGSVVKVPFSMNKQGNSIDGITVGKGVFAKQDA